MYHRKGLLLEKNVLRVHIDEVISSSDDPEMTVFVPPSQITCFNIYPVRGSVAKYAQADKGHN